MDAPAAINALCEKSLRYVNNLFTIRKQFVYHTETKPKHITAAIIQYLQEKVDAIILALGKQGKITFSWYF